MKHLLISSLLAVCAAQPNAMMAQTPQTKEAAKAMLQVFTYDADGKLLKQGTAFFINGNGDAVTTYALMANAARAEVVDTKGKKRSVHRILGANSSTDLVKFSTIGSGKNAFLTVCEDSVKAGENVQLIHFSTEKKGKGTAASITASEPYNDYRYYHLNVANDEAYFALPIVDEKGRLVGISQRNVGKNATTSCAVDARFIGDLKITAASAINTDLRSLSIPRALPVNKEDARSYIYMLGSADSVISHAAYDDYIAAYPQSPEGYTNRAAFMARHKQYAKADEDYAMALSKAASVADSTEMSVDAIHYNKSVLYYRTLLAQDQAGTVLPGWTIEAAEAEADEAYKLVHSPLYIMQKGYCQFASKNYKGAAESFCKAAEDRSFASPEVYFSAARALELSQADSTKVLAMLDSCIASCSLPISASQAQYLLERSQRYLRAGRYKDAVKDYNAYEIAIGPKNLNEQFYYLREQAELEARMYQQALDDIQTAIAIARNPLPYRIEETLILLRAGEYERAIQTGLAVLEKLPDNADCLKFVGIAYGESGQKAKALQYLQKAKDNGDETADSFMNKYKP